VGDGGKLFEGDANETISSKGTHHLSKEVLDLKWKAKNQQLYRLLQKKNTFWQYKTKK